MPISIGTAHDRGNRHNSRITIKAVFRDKGIKAAAFADMRELDTRHVIGCGPRFLSDAHNLIRWHEQEFGLFVDEPGNQPGASNTVNDRTFAGDPFHNSSPSVEHQRYADRVSGCDIAGEDLRSKAALAQFGVRK